MDEEAARSRRAEARRRARPRSARSSTNTPSCGMLGRGGMGAVYEARHARLARRFAIKFLLAEFAANREVLRRFENEAKAAGGLEHPNLAAVTDFGRADDGSPYLVMEFLEGEDCAKLLRRQGRIAAARAAQHRRAGLPGPGRRAQGGHRSPRSQARKPVRDRRRRRKRSASRSSTSASPSSASPTPASSPARARPSGPPTTCRRSRRAAPATSTRARTSGRWASCSTSCWRDASPSSASSSWRSFTRS